MTADEYRQGSAHDEALKVGDKCVVRWTNNHHYHRSEGIIHKLNRMTVNVLIGENRTIQVPRFVNYKLWSANNCVEPYDYPSTENLQAQAGSMG
jgi:hypothetical protein